MPDAACDNGNMETAVATPKRQREAADGDPSWDAWWAAWPRKVAKGAARKAFPKALDKVDGDVARLVAGAERVAAQLEARRRNPRPDDRGRDPMTFVPHPATWLRAEQWEDDETIVDDNPRSRRWEPVKRDQECPEHPGEHRDRCRACAADKLAKPDDPVPIEEE